MSASALEEINAAIAAVWSAPTELPPNTVRMPLSTYIWIGRFSMTKRRWRRWRGKLRAEARKALNVRRA